MLHCYNHNQMEIISGAGKGGKKKVVVRGILLKNCMMVLLCGHGGGCNVCSVVFLSR